VPPVRELVPGHQVKCHLSQEMFDQMEPVITVAAE
jgi:peptide/nickel transport system ATP-binding protein